MHIGNRIKEVMKERGMSVVAFSRQLGCSRTNTYKLFEHYSIDTMQLLRISRILNHDFFADYQQELRKDIFAPPSKNSNLTTT